MHGSGAGLLSLLLLTCTSLFSRKPFSLPARRRTMASADEFTPAFVQNMLAVQQQNVELFQTAMRLGLGFIGLEVGSKVINFTYDKVQKFWKAEIPARGQPMQLQWMQSDNSGSDGARSIRRALGFEDIELTPDNSQTDAAAAAATAAAATAAAAGRATTTTTTKRTGDSSTTANRGWTANGTCQRPR